jgi:isoleucyl-tRNA synthetase
LKVRQPLARALAFAGGKRNLADEYLEIITDELNVKAFEFVEQASQLVTYQVLPDNKLLGPRFGAQFPRLRAALSAADPGAVAAAVQAGQPFSLELDGQPVDLQPQELLVSTRPASGLAVAADKLATVAVDAILTSELRAEGLAREVVRRIQAMRKDAGFEIADRITTYYQAQNEMAAVFVAWAEYIQAETLSTALVSGQAPSGAYAETQNVEGQALALAVRRN